ncbi:Monodehydroascorbate reductase 4, peroxisomal [Linum perenne]
MVVVGIGGIKTNGRMQTSNASVYAVGDVATFPVKLFGETRRLEHVDCARKSTEDFNYLPFFYSRVFAFSWQFYGDNAGEVVHFGDFSGNRIGGYWVSKGHLVGSFLEGGTKEEYEAIAMATKAKPAVEDLVELESQGLEFAFAISKKPVESAPGPSGDGNAPGLDVEKAVYHWNAAAGVVVAASVAAFAYWYGRRRKRW